MRRVLSWLACAALVASPAWGEEKADAPSAVLGTFTVIDSPYWIGAMCRPTDAEVREQLELDDVGLTVFQVLPDSPAAKGGLKMHDVITRADGQPISTVPQLMEAVSDGKKLELEVIRSGKKEKLTVEPAKRPEGDVLMLRGRQLDGEQAAKMRELTEKMRARLPEAEARQMQEWVEKMRRGEQTPLRMHMFGPGVVMHSAAAPLPDGVTVTIKKSGAGPTTITVERGDETWTLNDKELHRLPKDLQGPVGAMVGGGQVSFNVQSQGAVAVGTASSDAGAVQVQIQTSDATGPQAVTLPLPKSGAATPPTASKSDSTELESLQQQVRQLQRQVEELQKKNNAASPAAESKSKSK